MAIKDFIPLIGAVVGFLFGLISLVFKENIEFRLKRKKATKTILKIKKYLIENLTAPEFTKLTSTTKSSITMNDLENISKAGKFQIKVENLLEIIDNQKKLIIPYITMEQYFHFIEMNNSLTYLQKLSNRVSVIMASPDRLKDHHFALIALQHKSFIKKCSNLF